MDIFSTTGRLFKVCEAISRLAYVNLLWILFTLLGLGFFGFIPATVSLFAITRKWVMGETDISVFSTFWKVFRQEFFKSNLLGFSLFVIGYILYIDLAYLPIGGILTVLRWCLIIFGLLFLVVLLYIFPLYVHYEWQNRLYIKFALLIGASYPHFTLMMLIGIATLYYIMITIPGLIPFFSMSVLSYIIMWSTYQVFQKIEAAQEVGGDKTVDDRLIETESLAK